MLVHFARKSATSIDRLLDVLAPDIVQLHTQVRRIFELLIYAAAFVGSRGTVLHSRQLMAAHAAHAAHAATETRRHAPWPMTADAGQDAVCPVAQQPSGAQCVLNSSTAAPRAGRALRLPSRCEWVAA